MTNVKYYKEIIYGKEDKVTIVDRLHIFQASHLIYLDLIMKGKDSVFEISVGADLEP